MIQNSKSTIGMQGKVSFSFSHDPKLPSLPRKINHLFHFLMCTCKNVLAFILYNQFAIDGHLWYLRYNAAVDILVHPLFCSNPQGPMHL